MLIPSAIADSYYSSVLAKTIEVEAHGTVIIGKKLKPTSGNHFSQEIHVENLEASQEVQKAMEFDDDFNKMVISGIINNALSALEDAYNFVQNEA